jgi:hypothetical protein
VIGLPPATFDAAGDAETGAPPGTVAAGELAFEGGGPAFAEATAGELETAVPCTAGAGDATGAVAGEVAGAGEVADAPGEAAGLAAPPGAGLSCCAGARAPMFAMSCPIRIFPRNTGRSKM